MMPDQAEELCQLLKDAALTGSLQKSVFSSPQSPEQRFARVDVRPVEVHGEKRLQFTSHTATQEFHRNLNSDESADELVRMARGDYRNIRLVTTTSVCEARFSRKGKCFLRIEQLSNNLPASAVPHDRTRNYLIPEGIPCPFLIQTGVMTAEGKVRASHFRKFRQINRFLEFIRDITDWLPTERPVNVVDFGCGKSYLTFATHYLLKEVLKRECRVVGLDRRADVVETCTKIVQTLGLQDLEFRIGEIAGYTPSVEVDLVISLHACDTATDEALSQAVQWNCPVILAVPCCQHELNAHLGANSFAPLTTFGVSKERLATLATDALRTSLMTAAGYQTQLMEFIETEHTPRNLLIRCVRSNQRPGTRSIEKKALDDVRQLNSQLSLPTLTLERRLRDAGILPEATNDLRHESIEGIRTPVKPEAT
jgi:trans-aconitate methyltransferase